MPAPAPPKDDISFTRTQQENLQHLSDLLHLFHHRNKNQHRRSIWYRHFSTFRKQLSLLLDEIFVLSTVPETHLERSRKRKRDGEVQDRVKQRFQVWQDVYVRKWHLAFSQLVADGRFAVLGVVLMAVLSEVCGVVGVTEGLEVAAEEDVRKVIEKFEREMGGEVGGDWREASGGEDVNSGKSGEDVGVAVKREEPRYEDEDSGQVLGRYEGMSEKARKKMGEVSNRNGLPGHENGRTSRRPRIAAETEATLTKTEQDSLPDEDLDEVTMRPPAAKDLDKRADSGKLKRSPSPTKPKIAKKTKKRRKGDAIDDLFSGLG